jgi:hypothetical protein
MDLEWARSSLDAERTRVHQLLANLGVDRTDHHGAERGAAINYVVSSTHFATATDECSATLPALLSTGGKSLTRFQR